MDKPTVLIVESDDEVRTQMKRALHSAYDLLVAENRHAALDLLERQRPAVATLDLRLDATHEEPQEGFAALMDMLQLDPLLKVVVITGQREKSVAIEAIRRGAHDFLCTPVNIDELKTTLSRAFHTSEIEREHRQSRSIAADSLENLIGSSPQMQGVVGTIRTIAPTDAHVLIAGQRGTGKEMAARAVHRLSSRHLGPFIAINCRAVPEDLLESELFGHERFDAAGLHVQQLGRIEMAQHGTLFLDEIDELSATLQVKLHRFLQEREVGRVGGRSLIPVDVRVIAATNVDLAKAVAARRFREDLYYSLAVVVITMPPLRERHGDIVELASALLNRHAGARGKLLSFTPSAIHAMESHGWPGNVRELENRIQRAAIMAESAKVTPEDLELTSIPEEKALGRARQNLERHMIESAIARNHGNLSRTAIELEISRPTLYELIEKLGISRKPQSA